MSRETVLQELSEAIAVYRNLCDGDMEWMDIPGPERRANDEALVDAKARIVSARGRLEDMGSPELE